MRVGWCGVLLAAGLPGQGVAPQTFEKLEGGQIRGALAAIELSPTEDGEDARVRIELADGSSTEIALDELARIRFGDGPSYRAPAAEAGELRMRSGLVSPARLVGAHGRSLAFDLGVGASPATVDLSHVAALRFGAAREDDGGFARAVENPSDTDDLLFAHKPDGSGLSRLSVQVLGVTDDGIEVEFRGAAQTPLPIERAYGIVLGRDNGISPERQPKPRADVILRDGPSLAGKLIGWDAAGCHLRLDEGAVLDVPIELIAEIGIQSGRIAWLSDLEPKVEQTPAFDRVRPWLRDATPRGKGIRLGGREYRRGLCLMPRTTMTFALEPGQFDVFESVIGIDDRSSSQAHAVFRVLADEEVVYEAEAVTLADAPKELRIPLAGVRKLTLQTDFGKNFDLGDHCVFAEARLLKN